MVVVNLNYETRFDEFRSDRLYAERPVEEEYGPIRRLRNGSLFDRVDLQMEVLRKIRNGIAGFLSFVDGRNRYAGACDYRAAKRNGRVHDKQGSMIMPFLRKSLLDNRQRYAEAAAKEA